MFCLFVKKVCFKFLLANFEHDIVQKLLKLLNYFTIFIHFTHCSLNAHVIDVCLINQLSNKMSLYFRVTKTYHSSEPLITGLGPGET